MAVDLSMQGQFGERREANIPVDILVQTRTYIYMYTKYTKREPD